MSLCHNPFDRPSASTAYEPHFANVRWNLVRGIFRTHYEGCGLKKQRANDSHRLSEDGDTISWDSLRLAGEGYLFHRGCLASHGSELSWASHCSEDGRERKQARDGPRPLRVPQKSHGANSSARVSRSSRLSRQLPKAASKREKAWSRRCSRNGRKQNAQAYSHIKAEASEELCMQDETAWIAEEDEAFSGWDRKETIPSTWDWPNTNSALGYADVEQHSWYVAKSSSWRNDHP